MASKSPKVAVWYMGLLGPDVHGDGGCDDALAMLRTLYNITASFDRAYEIVSYGKGVVLENLHPEAANVVVRWIESGGRRRPRGHRVATRSGPSGPTETLASLLQAGWPSEKAITASRSVGTGRLVCGRVSSVRYPE